jgi:hypothetical protein
MIRNLVTYTVDGREDTTILRRPYCLTVMGAQRILRRTEYCQPSAIVTRIDVIAEVS